MIYNNCFVALYDKDDVCVFIADNWIELAKYLKKPVSNVQSSLSHILKHNTEKRRNFNVDGQKLTPYVFCADDNDEDEY